MNWISYVKNVAEEKGIKYNVALSVASASYHKEKGTKPKPKIKNKFNKKLTGKFILRNLKKLIDNGEIYKGQSKKEMLEVLRNKN
tara:strand:- start:1002 stop:1256 length:255 start_codon:yes stop_codon:yes gene_type:complete